jgi:hypothetical protein
MEIVYKDIHEFKKEDLESLFLSVEWSSGHYPDKLVVAMQYFETVYTAWDGDQLVGLICGIDLCDGRWHHDSLRPLSARPS